MFFDPLDLRVHLTWEGGIQINITVDHKTYKTTTVVGRRASSNSKSQRDNLLKVVMLRTKLLRGKTVIFIVLFET